MTHTLTTHPRILTWLAILLFFAAPWQAYALPPLGLTQVTQVGSFEDEDARLAVIGQVGYVSYSEGVQPIDQDGLLPLVVPLEPTFGPLMRTTRVIEDSNGKVFFSASFDRVDIFFGTRGGLYRIDDSSNPIFIKRMPTEMSGFDSSLRGYTVNSQWLPDGTVTSPIPYIPTEPGLGEFLSHDVTPNGYILGTVHFLGTIGGGSAVRNPQARLEVLGGSEFATSIQDRLDDNGVNIGLTSERLEGVRYGDGLPIDIDSSLGLASGSPTVIVSESDFTIISGRFSRGRPGGHRLYYPGVNPAGSDRSVALLDFYPELQSIDIDKVIEATSAGGQIHLLLSGDDGLWLFAAPDPSLIPEPGTMTLLMMAVLRGLSLRRRRLR